MDGTPYHSFRIYNPEGEIEAIEYQLSVSDGYVTEAPVLTINDPGVIEILFGLVDDDGVRLVEDVTQAWLVEDAQYVKPE